MYTPDGGGDAFHPFEKPERYNVMALQPPVSQRMPPFTSDVPLLSLRTRGHHL